jgi:hypothetical protein
LLHPRPFLSNTWLLLVEELALQLTVPVEVALEDTELGHLLADLTLIQITQLL